jgi:hypothetical protein
LRTFMTTANIKDKSRPSVKTAEGRRNERVREST